MDWSSEDVEDMYKHKDESLYKPGNMPLIVISCNKGGFDQRADSLQLENERLHAQDELVKLSFNSKHVIDMNSAHNIHVEDPATVIAAIKKVYTSVTKHIPLKQVK